jgi:TatD DNase family protein
MSWCDIGVNFTDKRFFFEQVLKRALAADVTHIIITGTNLGKSHQGIQMAEQYPGHLFTTVGLHPHEAKLFNDQTINELKALAKSNHVVAIGECGLDFNRNFSTPNEQLIAFEEQLKLACELDLPVFLHERNAFQVQYQLLKEYHKDLKGGVVHCFTGNIEQMDQYLDLGLYIGVTGWVCDPNRGQELSSAVKSLPLNRLLLETDAPYLRPKGLANNRKVDSGNNEPAYLPYIAAHVAQLMDTDITTLQKATQTNAQVLFNLTKSEINLAD